MKKFLFILLGTLISLPAFARDFEYTYEGQTLTYTVIDETAKTCKTKEGYFMNAGNKVSGALIIPSTAKDGAVEYTVTEIGYDGFCYCEDLTSVEIPNTVTAIGYAALRNCTSMTSVEIGNSVTSIGMTAFYECTSLTSITIPNSVTSIDNSAFSYCTGLTLVKIGSSLSSLAESVFGYCPSMTSFEVSSENQSYASSDGVLFNKELSTLIQFPGGRTGGYEIPSSVTTISKASFARCNNLTSVKIPNTVTIIEDNAFLYCEGLKSIEIPASVSYIGNNAFLGCNFSIEVSVENQNYASLEGVLFNKDLSTLIHFPGAKTGQYAIPSSVISISDYAFYECTGLTSVEIPNSVTSINDYAFCFCTGLTSVEIPNSVAYIGNYTFCECTSLTSVEIPTSVTHIGNCAFGWCEALTSVYYGADEPIEGDSSIFSESMYENATLYMSEKGIVKGRTIDPWKNFAKIEVYDPTDGINAVDADIDFNQSCEVYCLSGAKVGNTTENLVPGIYIIRQGNAVKKIVVKKI